MTATRINRRDGKLLWSGVYYMHENHVCQLAEPVSKQDSGIVLVWSGYSGGAAQNYNWCYQFIPKAHVMERSGQGVTCICAGYGFSPVAAKYVYVSDTQITGNARNAQSGTTNGISWANTSFVLREVRGV